MKTDKPCSALPSIPKFVIHNHWLAGVIQRPSPFYNQRPQGLPISLLVIHCISLPRGAFDTDYVCQLFMGELSPDGPCSELIKTKVSTHLFIRRNGEIIQFVPFSARAWHAGASSFQGVPNCNDYSIGIELEGTDSSAFTATQYASLIGITRALFIDYPELCDTRITGHSDIALPPGRKTDPGTGMDWNLYLSALFPASTQVST